MGTLPFQRAEYLLLFFGQVLERAGQAFEGVVTTFSVLLLKLGEAFAGAARAPAYGRIVESHALLGEVLSGEHIAAPVEAFGDIFMLCRSVFRMFLRVFFEASGSNAVKG